TGKSKKNLKHEMKKINENTIEIIKNNLNDLELMFKLNVNEFGENSWFESAHMQDVFCEILKLKYDIYLFTYLINGVKQGVSLSLKYKNRMLLLNYNSNKSNVPNLGKYIILHTMQNAIDEGSLYFDVGIGDCNWKEHWHFEKRALHKYYFNYKSSSENSFTISS
ncbi:MAG TPA: GNAT family N-acetyltransferase, partial [Candidatus Nitrosocosmicus sp.]|nr:GNAT family N-acetyltransferase [Candidatus Nitrosocosmicus sp.]